jgi:hypothetical protein
VRAHDDAELDGLCLRRGPGSQVGCRSYRHYSGAVACLSESDRRLQSILRGVQGRVSLARSKHEHIHSCASRCVPRSTSSDQHPMDGATGAGIQRKLQASSSTRFCHGSVRLVGRIACMGGQVSVPEPYGNGRG